jgi:hypothetical protein
MARLSTLSPRVIEAVLEGNYPASLIMKDLLKPLSTYWAAQEREFLKEINEG